MLEAQVKIKELQERNCKGCLYSVPEKVGTGKACCTCPGLPWIEDDKCFTKRQRETTRVLPAM